MLWQTFTIELLKLLVDLLKGAAWPAVIGIGLWHFRAQLGALLKAFVDLVPRLISLKAPWLELTAKEAAQAKEETAAHLQEAAKQLVDTDDAAERVKLVNQIASMGAEIERLTRLQSEAEAAEQERDRAKRFVAYHEALQARLAKEQEAVSSVPPDALSSIGAWSKDNQR